MKKQYSTFSHGCTNKVSKDYLPSVETFADDTQLYISFKNKADTNKTISEFEKCIDRIRSWMLSNNDSKTKILILGYKNQMKKINNINIHVGNSRISLVKLPEI